MYIILMELDGRAANFSVTSEEEKKYSCEVNSYLETLSCNIVAAENELKECEEAY